MTSDQAPVTKKEMAELLTEFRDDIHDRLDRHERRFDSIDQGLDQLNKRIDRLDDLIETVATEVNSISTILEPLIPVQHDHEQRISRLERGYTRLILKS